MPTPNLVLHYVTDVRRSAAFWSGLLGNDPIELSDGFAMLPLGGGLMLGLWNIAGVAPATTTCGGGGELCFSQPSRAAVDAIHAEWIGRGMSVIQAPTDMDFGYTFTAVDPDGHRIRVLHPVG